ncbi:MAG: hypothetical protein P9X24_04480 [Candidatus Hatepunaea meridiana]|nr:hypothetical protein [Candidatus Hatepunaea meridiana]
MDERRIFNLVLNTFTKSSTSYMRSIGGVARETGLDENVVRDCIVKHPELFEYAPVVAPSTGSTIYQFLGEIGLKTVASGK